MDETRLYEILQASARRVEGRFDVDSGWETVSEYTVRVIPRVPLVGISGGLGAKGFEQPLSRRVFSLGTFPRWLGYAAAVVIVAVFGLRYVPLITGTSSPGPGTRVYSTTTAQRAKINLPDGSSVLLAPASKIQYAAGFGGKHRTIHLQGRALFTVVKDGRPPFIVNAFGVSTRVLGTTFDIRAYDANVRIVVAEGKVSVASHTLSIGDVATVTGNTAHVQHNANITDLLAWTAGRLVYRDTPLREVLADFRRTYGIHVQLADPAVGGRLVTVSIGDMTATGAVDMLAGILGLRVQRRDGVTLLTE